ncbi:hypothetical protein [Microbacterium sp. MYb62]|uniref:hypothetical protein n=1 Tax=Microbacterium sp. MYb62 TaxID=1848690 RepID=UPI000CFC3AFC|nr:hypothetical protein [Microbacterium sp. MYb62]PRB17274.1 hypothetical protein CQ042_05620 [Microbacterium sp. MYb62]
MTFGFRPHRSAVAAAVALVAMLGFASCAPAVTSPIGVWEAVGDDNGTLTIKNDGTFTMTDASFNPLQYRATQDDFRGSGVWEIFSDDPPLVLRFDEATNGDFPVEPAALQVDFTSGTIRFEDPELTASIEFRITD